MEICIIGVECPHGPGEYHTRHTRRADTNEAACRVYAASVSFQARLRVGEGDGRRRVGHIPPPCRFQGLLVRERVGGGVWGIHCLCAVLGVVFLVFRDVRGIGRCWRWHVGPMLPHIIFSCVLKTETSGKHVLISVHFRKMA